MLYLTSVLKKANIFFVCKQNMQVSRFCSRQIGHVEIFPNTNASLAENIICMAQAWDLRFTQSDWFWLLQFFFRSRSQYWSFSKKNWIDIGFQKKQKKKRVAKL